MPSFDAYLMVDWSAANVPRRGRDSIWLGLTMRLASGRLRLTRIENPATRAAATERVVRTIALGSNQSLEPGESAPVFDASRHWVSD